MTTNLRSFMTEYKAIIDKELVEQIDYLSIPTSLKESMIYSVSAGGKRIRPVLLLATIEAFGKSPALGIKAAVALEMVHTYSLIHDDLPSMDDDDLRRGKPTNHKVFGEATAILAGDALLTYSFEVIASMKDILPQTKIELVRLFAKAAGPEGMVGGQVADMEGERKTLTLEELEYIHRNKTGKLLQYAVVAGAIIGGASKEEVRLYKEYAEHIGLAFQIKDDILDIEGTEDKIGKRVGSDVNNDKSTYPSLLTLEGAKEKLEYHRNEAHSILHKTSQKTVLLNDLIEMIVSRDH
ncbi:farnesyl-diphosphate synthase [Bacillus coahuilensis m2-6]|uniref:Farnesyl diphosphate synthase n=1 Tax=Bacillus coahuilensis p1.1.43 TaxID=1150625 RepID=A0A147K7S7_9BACI|nr:farnesyl diphosphate synthase [Bacillus coahuilensis]KUP06170.1 farnesyl-diphosphate synthase [Bacillus coahuilensis p1.1.43]KUP07358.1 farnesyl-diphosphate synthase [Bacillus coahuilensis m2-6]